MWHVLLFPPYSNVLLQVVSIIFLVFSITKENYLPYKILNIPMSWTFGEPWHDTLILLIYKICRNAICEHNNIYNQPFSILFYHCTYVTSKLNNGMNNLYVWMIRRNLENKNRN
jgi:hypothetical protein